MWRLETYHYIGTLHSVDGLECLRFVEVQVKVLTAIGRHSGKNVLGIDRYCDIFAVDELLLEQTGR